MGMQGEPVVSVTSLDQLMTQARGTDPLLKKKVQQWAGVSAGYFALNRMFWTRIEEGGDVSRTAMQRALSQRGVAAFLSRKGTVQQGEPLFNKYVRWDTIADDQEQVQRIKWAKIKTPSRAMEKLMRVYQGNVSRLVDLTRQSIVFEGIGDLVKCLEAILLDPEVVVLRIKNRLDKSYDSSLSAGYRDVALNVRIVSEEAIELALDTHVCEVQLILKVSFALENHQFCNLKPSVLHLKTISFA
eukprot:CAMPEP_0114125082 /NCGR_PEP_ID=MMETSP0043_2-20121206/9114_1 /TAXON_ID=464988 /ORGANISM="Hemiselmis andersenii, Strain CCMP644" /LENGTH=242 /DNA_ID=CAMNT_0001217991 /DNA_START=68 /DNA_END=793 /DNA_ORIENTATION=-